MDAAASQLVFRSFPYGLYAVTLSLGGDDHGMTANWVTQASFSPPMVAVAVENSSRTMGLVRDARYFVLNVFHEGQRDLAGKLARSGANKLKGVKTKPAPRWGGPILAEALGWLECRLVATLPAGDHTLVLGEVIEAGVEHGDAQALTLQQAGLTYGG